MNKKKYYVTMGVSEYFYNEYTIEITQEDADAINQHLEKILVDPTGLPTFTVKDIALIVSHTDWKGCNYEDFDFDYELNRLREFKDGAYIYKSYVSQAIQEYVEDWLWETEPETIDTENEDMEFGYYTTDENE